MSDLIEEVIIDANEERKIARFKTLLYSAFIATLVAAVGMLIWSNRASKIAEYRRSMSDIFVSTIDGKGNDNNKTSLEALELVTEKKNIDLADLALIEKAGIMTTANLNKSEKLRLIEDLVVRGSAKEFTKYYGKVMWMSTILTGDTNKLSEDEARIFQEFSNDFAEDTAPFFGYASILRAAIEIKYKNDNNAAKKILDKVLLSRNVNHLMREQAKALLANINFSEK